MQTAVQTIIPTLKPLEPQALQEAKLKVETTISAVLEPMGFEIVDMEFLSIHQKTLRLYIDHIKEDEPETGSSITVDDCAKVSHALDLPLEAISEPEKIFLGPYDLEVSSPGIDRPIRKEKDFKRFVGKKAKIQVLRPLTPDEIENGTYLEKNPKQKAFYGVLRGIEKSKVLLEVVPEDGAVKTKPGKTKKKPEKVFPKIFIPLGLVSKAHLDPNYETLIKTRSDKT